MILKWFSSFFFHFFSFTCVLWVVCALNKLLHLSSNWVVVSDTSFAGGHHHICHVSVQLMLIVVFMSLWTIVKCMDFWLVMAMWWWNWNVLGIVISNRGGQLVCPTANRSIHRLPSATKKSLLKRNREKKHSNGNRWPIAIADSTWWLVLSFNCLIRTLCDAKIVE